jgi:hypothetical protein
MFVAGFAEPELLRIRAVANKLLFSRLIEETGRLRLDVSWLTCRPDDRQTTWTLLQGAR